MNTRTGARGCLRRCSADLSGNALPFSVQPAPVNTDMRQTIKKLSCIGLTGARELTLRLRRLEKNCAREAVLQAYRRTYACAAGGCGERRA